MQINPPYDASAPCAGCQLEVRGVAALIHNFLNRCDVAAGRIREAKAMVKLNDLRWTQFPAALTVEHPVAAEIVAVGRALVGACEGMTDDGGTIRWNPEITARVEALIQRAAAASDAYAVVSDAHFADQRHASGEPNILRASAGSKFAGHVKPDHAAARYDYTVDVVSVGGDLTHSVCGTQLKLHEHFRERIAVDPTFYGKVWCPTCRANVPMAQFVAAPLAAAA